MKLQLNFCQTVTKLTVMHTVSCHHYSQQHVQTNFAVLPSLNYVLHCQITFYTEDVERRLAIYSAKKKNVSTITQSIITNIKKKLHFITRTTH